MEIVFGVLLGLFLAAVGGLFWRGHIIATAVEGDLLRELQRRRFERALKTKIDNEVHEELRGPRPPPPAPMTRKE